MSSVPNGPNSIDALIKQAFADWLAEAWPAAKAAGERLRIGDDPQAAKTVSSFFHDLSGVAKTAGYELHGQLARRGARVARTDWLNDPTARAEIERIWAALDRLMDDNRPISDPTVVEEVRRSLADLSLDQED